MGFYSLSDLAEELLDMERENKDRRTLLRDVMNILAAHKKALEEILYVAVGGDMMNRMTVEKFLREAAGIRSDDGAVMSLLQDPIVIKAPDWMLERDSSRSAGEEWVFEYYKDPLEEIIDDPDLHLLLDDWNMEDPFPINKR